MYNSKSVILNFIWRFAERCGAQGVSFIVSIVLARILAPEAYGTIALVTVITNLLQVFVDSGFGNALIQKKEADDLDYSTVFFFNVVACSFLYLVVFYFAPLIADFYGRTELVSLIRVLSLTLVVSGVKNVQQAYIAKNMLFKRFFFATLGGTICAAIIGIVTAYLGFGVWALVIQQLVNISVDTIILWITVKWRPRFIFSIQRLKGLFSYGRKLLMSSLLETGYNELRALIIGKKYSSSDLAFYNKGKQLPNIIITNINTSIDSVLLPIMATEQNEIERIKLITRRSIRTSSYIIMPMMVGLAVCAEPVICLLLTEKWLPCVLYLRVFCFTYAFYPIATANLSALKAMGRSDMFLKLEIWKKVVGIVLLLTTMFISVKAMAYSLLLSTISGLIINSWPNKKLLDYSLGEQMKDIISSILLAVGMGVVVFFIGFLPIPTLPLLLIQVICGGVIYVLGSEIIKLEPYMYVKEIVFSFVRRR